MRGVGDVALLLAAEPRVHRRGSLLLREREKWEREKKERKDEVSVKEERGERGARERRSGGREGGESGRRGGVGERHGKFCKVWRGVLMAATREGNSYGQVMQKTSIRERMIPCWKVERH